MSLFLNTRIEGQGKLAQIGDYGLTPCRYLFNGKTIQIDPSNTVHHTRSFQSDTSGKLRTIGALALLIPGLVLSIFKLIGYLFPANREAHRLIKQHFTPLNRAIGSAAHPIKNIRELEQALLAEQTKPHLTDALIIYGDGKLNINEDPGILALNPMKLILIGARLIQHPTKRVTLQQQMREKWNVGTYLIERAATLEEALKVKAPLREYSTWKRKHLIFELK